jgi:hypothetical protein
MCSGEKRRGWNFGSGWDNTTYRCYSADSQHTPLIPAHSRSKNGVLSHAYT